MKRVILLGASNVTLGFPLIAEILRAGCGPVELFAAHGHGRSYGMGSRVMCRGLPSIRACRLWRDLERSGPCESRPWALVTDIGNDLLYGADPERIAGWVDACVSRLLEMQADITLATLPLESVLRLGRVRFSLTRAFFFPGSPLTWERMQPYAIELDQRLQELARRHGLKCVIPRREWYGFDPIHIRRRMRPCAWASLLAQEAVCADNAGRLRPGVRQSLRLWTARPAVRTLFGVRQQTDQPVLRLGDGSTIWLY